MRDIIRQRRSAAFFGRENHRSDYRANLALAPDNEARRFIYNIHGNAGVGKTLLLREFQQIAVEEGLLTVRVDDEHTDGAIDMLNSVAEQMKSQGVRLEHYIKQHNVYLKTRHELLSSSDVPDGIASMLTHGLTHVGFMGAAALTGVDVAGHLHPHSAASAIDEGRTWLMGRVREPQSLRLALDPIGELTRLFLQELDKNGGGRSLALFFDTFEDVAPPAQTWLLDLIEGEKYGSLPDDIVITIAGQHKPDPNAWSLLRPVTVDVELSPFTQDESSRLLERHGITNPDTIASIWELTGGLPVLVDTLAQSTASGRETITDPSGGAVDRFLKGVDDPEQRRIARLCALPQYLNQDVLSLFLTEEDQERAAELFAWLRSLRFVIDAGGRCHYHQVVRSLMVRLQRNSSPAEFVRHHGSIAEYYERVGEPGPSLQQTYHRLCADPTATLPAALSGAADAAADGAIAARRWTRMLEQAAIDSGDAETGRWAARLGTALGGEDPDRTFLTRLIDEARLPDAAMYEALSARWRVLYESGRYADAFEDVERAIRLCPDDSQAHIRRGRTHSALGRPDAAIADFTQAVELAPDKVAPLVQRGLTLQSLGNHGAAIADYTRAVGMRPEDGHLLAHRGEMYRLRGQHAKSLADLDRAVRLAPDDEWAVYQRGVTHRSLGERESAIADFSRAIDLEPRSGTLLERGIERQHLGDFEGALADYNRAIELDPGHLHVLAHRGDLHLSQRDGRAAIADLDQVIASVPDDSWAIGRRVLAHLMMDDHPSAATDYRRAAESVPTHIAGMLLLMMEESSEALPLLEQAVQAVPGRPDADPWQLFLVGLAANRCGERERAEEYLRRGVVEGERLREQAPRDEANVFNPAMCHFALGEADRAVAMVQAMMADGPSPSRVAEALSNLRRLRPVISENTEAYDRIIGLLAETAEQGGGATGRTQG